MAKIKGTIVVDKERCKGCGVCVASCPCAVLELSAEVNSKGLSGGPDGESRRLHGLRLVRGDLSRQRHHGLSSKIRIAMAEKEIKLMKGNEVIAHAAIRYGCDGYFGYPITPQSEVMETLMEPQALGDDRHGGPAGRVGDFVDQHGLRRGFDR